MRVRTRDIVGRYLDRLLIFAVRDADEASVVGIGRQALTIRHKRVDELAERRRDRLLMRQTVERRALTATRVSAAVGHVGCLIPAQYSARRAQIADLAQAPLEPHQPMFGGAVLARGLAGGGLPRSRRFGFAGR